MRSVLTILIFFLEMSVTIWISKRFEKQICLIFDTLIIKPLRFIQLRKLSNVLSKNALLILTLLIFSGLFGFSFGFLSSVRSFKPIEPIAHLPYPDYISYSNLNYLSREILLNLYLDKHLNISLKNLSKTDIKKVNKLSNIPNVSIRRSEIDIKDALKSLLEYKFIHNKFPSSKNESSSDFSITPEGEAVYITETRGKAVMYIKNKLKNYKSNYWIRSEDK